MVHNDVIMVMKRVLNMLWKLNFLGKESGSSSGQAEGNHEEKARSKGTKFIVSLHYTLLLVLCSQFWNTTTKIYQFVTNMISTLNK